MKALISAQAGVAILPGDEFEARPVEGSSYRFPPVMLDRVLAGCDDVEEVTAGSVEEIDALARTAWAADRAVLRVRMLLDLPDMSAELERRMVADVERFMATADVDRLVAARLGRLKLGPDLRERAETLLGRYRQLDPLLRRTLDPAPISRLLRKRQARDGGQTARPVKPARPAGSEGTLRQASFRYLRSRSARPDTRLENMARGVIDREVRLFVDDFPDPGSWRLSSLREKSVVARRLAQRANRALDLSGIAGRVQQVRPQEVAERLTELMELRAKEQGLVRGTSHSVRALRRGYGR